MQALLIYLLVETMNQPAGGMGREPLMTLLWPHLPRKSAQDNLRQSLYQLKRAIPAVPAGNGESVPLIASDRHIIQIHPQAHYQLDVKTFRRLVEQDEIDGLVEAGNLYRGPFLADFYLEDCSEFEYWAAKWRGLFQRQVLGALDRLVMHYLKHDQAGEAAAWARRQLEIDDLRESGHRHLIAALDKLNRPAAAIQQYERCRKLFEEQLGLDPSAETERLIQAIRRRSRSSAAGRSRPVPETPIIGREKEIEEITALFREEARLLTIVGPGGMGKTRLAFEVARRLEGTEATDAATPGYAGEKIVFMDLSPMANARELIVELCHKLDLVAEQDDPEGLQQRLLRYLPGRALLLFFDNFEHVLDGAALLKKILPIAPGVKILVTSRERLKLRAEHVYPLSGLRFSQWQSPESAGRDAAVQLFQYHARRVRPGFVLRREQVKPMQDILQLTGGIPLALILAAGWTRILSLAEIAQELRESLDFLEATHGDVPERQRSMRVVFQSTWERLSGPAQAAFAALSVFPGGFTPAAANIVVGATRHTLMELMDSSLITRQANGRLAMHELLRQYAREMLAERGEITRICAAHCDYFCDFVGQREEDLKGGRVKAAADEITEELENIQAAWTWAADHQQGEPLRRAAAGLAIYYVRHNRLIEGPARFRDAAEKLADAHTVSPRAKAAIFITTSFLLSRNPATTGAGAQYARRAAELLDELTEQGEDVREERAWLLMTLGNNVREDGRQAQQLFRDSLERFTALELPWEMATAHDRLGMIYSAFADYRRAGKHLRQSQKLYAQSGDQQYALVQKLNLAVNQAFSGRLQEAESVLREGMSILQESGNPAHLGWFQMVFSEVLIFAGEFPEARSFLSAVQHSKATVHNPYIQVYSRLLDHWAEMHEGQYHQADALTKEIFVSAQEKAVQEYIGFSSLILGCTALVDKALTAARSRFQESVAAYARMNKHEERSWAQAGLAYVAVHDGDVDEARQYLVKALGAAPEYHRFRTALIALPAAALVMAAAGQRQQAWEWYALAGRFGFVANSRWFADVAGRNIRDLTASLPEKQRAAAEERSQTVDLWATIRTLLAALE